MYNNVYFTVAIMSINQWVLFGSMIALGVSLIVEPRYRKSIRRKMRMEKRGASTMEVITLASIHYMAYVAIVIEVLVFAYAFFTASNTIKSML